MPADPVPSPRSGGDDDEVAQFPQQRASADDAASATEPGSDDVSADDAADVATTAQHDRPADPSAPRDPAATPGALTTPRPAPDDEQGPVVPRLRAPRAAPDDDLDLLAVVAPTVARRTGPRVYADGTALAQYVAGASSHAEWLDWARGHEAELITTPLGLTELRRLASPAGVEARGVAREVEARVTVVRFSDQTLRAATKVSGVLPPFTALHIGAVLAHPEVVAVATYDTQLARVAALHGLPVVSPGLAPFWWESDD